MGQRFLGRWSRAVIWVILPAVWLASATLFAGDAPAVAKIDPERLWRLGADQVACGRFDEASATFDELLDAAPDNRSAEKIRSWLEAFRALEARRQQLRTSEREKHSQIARDRLAQIHLKPYWSAVFDKPVEVLDTIWENELLNKVLWPEWQPVAYYFRTFHRFHARMVSVDWTNALAEARYAFMNADDQDAFRQEAWLDTLVAESIAGAEAYRRDKEWVKAANIYFDLSEIFPDDAGFKEALDECTGHARLEAIYKPDGDWRQDIASIHRRMLLDVLDRIKRDYVRKPDFREITRSGLKALLLAVESDALKESFDVLKDEWLAQECQNRLRMQLQRIDRADYFGYSECRGYFLSALEINAQTVVLPEGIVVAELADGALTALDEFSSVIWPSAIDEFKKHTVGEFYGVGISINMQGGKITVFSPLEGTPAYEAGVQPGDVITKVNGESTAKFSLNEAVDKITGPKDTTVKLTIQRRGATEEIDLYLKRAKITIHTVKGVDRDAAGRWDYMLDPDNGIGYVRVTNFMENTTQELREALSELDARGAKGIILDLRFNPGGLLKSAVDMSDMFLRPGQIVVSTQGRSAQTRNEIRSGRADGEHTDVPLIVLVNDYSASASEIVSGAIKDHHRGRLVGERTFGKGSVQRLIRIDDQMGGPAEASAFLKLTTDHYYLPSGRCLHRDDDSETWGVDPDITVKLCPKETAYLLDVRRRAEVLRGKNQADDDDFEPDEGLHGAEADDIEVDADAQLEAALLAMRVRLLSHQDWPASGTDVAVRDAKPMHDEGELARPTTETP